MTRLSSALALGAALLLVAGSAAAQPAGHPAPVPGPAPGAPPVRVVPPNPARQFGPARGAKAPQLLGGPRRALPHGAKGVVHAAKGHRGGHGGGHAVHVNWWKARPAAGEPQPFLAAFFNFIVLALLLGRFGAPPIAQFVRERHERIGKDLHEAERLRAEAEARLKEYEAKIANLDHEIATLLQGIKAEGEAERARIIKAAEEQAERLRKDAESTIALDLKRARYEIEQEVVSSAIATAERILRERINETDQRGFVERYLVNLATEAPGTSRPQGGGAA
jgi:F-type H+-transporting ATPase subunit b